MKVYNMNFATGRLEAVEVDDKNGLRAGQVLRLHGYDEPEYVITANHGPSERFPEYGAQYDCVNLITGEHSTKQAVTLYWPGETVGIHTEITDRVMSAEELSQVLIEAATMRHKIGREKQVADDAKAAGRLSLPGRFPHLVQGSGAKAGAKNIRAELRREFPGVRFSVTIRTRGTNSIDVTWTDGPTSDEVEKVTGKYQEGSFDGMQDLYEYSGAIWPLVFGGARYVSESRHESAGLVIKAAAELGHILTSGECDNYGRLPGLDDDQSQAVHRHSRTICAA